MKRQLSIEALPHRPPMRWIASACSESEDEVVAKAVLPAEVGDGSMAPVLLGIEILAQAAGVLLADWSDGSHGMEGRLLRVKTVRWSRDQLPTDMPLEARVRQEEGSALGLHAFRGRLLDEAGEVCFEADFSLWVIDSKE